MGHVNGNGAQAEHHDIAGTSMPPLTQSAASHSSCTFTTVSFVLDRKNRLTVTVPVDGMMHVDCGDGSMGCLASKLWSNDSDDTPSMTDDTEFTWRWGARKRTLFEFTSDDYDGITARPSFSYVGVIPDDGRHDLSHIVNIRNNADTRTGQRPWYGYSSPVPSRVLVVYSDVDGNAICADGFRVDGLLRGTQWQEDARRSTRKNPFGNPDHVPDMPRISETPEEKERRHQLVRLAGYSMENHFGGGCLLGLVILASIFGGGVAFAMLGDKVGIDGVWNHVIAPAWLSILPLYLVIIMPALSRKMRHAIDNGQIEPRDIDEIGQRIKRNRVRVTVCGCLLALCVASSAWSAVDLFTEPETIDATYTGESAAQLDADIELAEESTDDDDGPSYPTISFKLDDGRTVETTGYPSVREKLSGDVRTGDRYRIDVYPHTGCFDKIRSKDE